MYLNLVIPLSYGDDGCHLIVTEACYMPERRKFEIHAGYVVEGYDFDLVYDAHSEEIQRAMKAWWEDDRYQNTNWEDYK